MEYCFFYSNKRLWAIEATAVSCIEPLHHVTPLPRSPQGLLGLIPFQGRLIPLVCKGILAEAKPEQALVLNSMEDSNNITHQMAIAIAKVVRFDHLDVPPRSIPAYSERWKNIPAYISMELHWQNQWIGVINPQLWVEKTAKSL